MFPEVNALPGPQRQPALANGDAKGYGRKGGAHMGGHIVVAFDGVRE